MIPQHVNQMGHLNPVCKQRAIEYLKNLLKLHAFTSKLNLRKQIQGACCSCRIGPSAIVDGVVPVPLGLPPTSKVSFLALLLRSGWNGAMNFHIFVLDLSLKQHIGLLQIMSAT